MHNFYGKDAEWNMNLEIFAAWLLVASLGFLFFVLYYFTVVRVPPKPIFEEFWAYFRLPASWEKRISDVSTQMKDRISKLRPPKRGGIELPRIQDATILDAKGEGPEEIVNAAVIGRTY